MIMGRVALILAACVILLASAPKAEAQKGFTDPLEANAESLGGSLPAINQPQPGWSPVLDLQQSDGTSPVPSCSDPAVIATVRDGILESINNQYQSDGATGTLANKAALSTIWVHPTYTGGTVCDMQVQVDVPLTGRDNWEFEPYATNGQTQVFFYDKNDQPSQ